MTVVEEEEEEEVEELSLEGGTGVLSASALERLAFFATWDDDLPEGVPDSSPPLTSGVTRLVDIKTLLTSAWEIAPRASNSVEILLS